MARFVVIVAAASVVGTAVGAALGAILSYTVGPHGTEGFVLLVVTWAIFAHLLIGLWAGYALLSDRSNRELLPDAATLTVQAEESAEAAIAERLRADGATQVSARGETMTEPATSRQEGGHSGEQIQGR